MKIVSLALATAVAAVIGSAPLLAQSPNNDTGGTSQSGARMNAPTHPGENQWDRDRDWNGRPGWQQGGAGYGWMGPGMMGPQAGWMMGPQSGSMMGQRPGWMMGRRAGWRRGHHHEPRGAHFRFVRGDARIDIQCPANQSLKDCVDAASTLIDKVANMGPPPPPPPGQPRPPAGSSGSTGSDMPGDMPGGMPGGGNRPNMPRDRM